MTEERMIRLTKEEWDELTDSCISHDGCPDWVFGMSIGFEDNGFNNLEPAPPKDFNPRCFGRCYKFPSQCQQCPKGDDCVKEHDRLRAIRKLEG